MKQTHADALTIVEGQSEPNTRAQTRQITTETQSHYAAADEFALEEYDYPVPGFIAELFNTLGKDLVPEDARLVDTVSPSKDIDDGLLVAYPDESLMFIGKDPTAKDAVPWYAFTIEPHEPLPAPETAQDALDLLKPAEVQDVIREDDWIPNRHGEWWLLPTQCIPGGTTFTPGVNSRPYGPSPLGNHVPREYAFTVTDSEFMQNFRANVDAPDSIATPDEVIEWSWRQQKKSVTPDGAPSWADIRTWAGEVLVRGTIRHRDDDHFVEDCGETWHKAVTHRIEVYTADEFGDVHLDYYGQT